MQAPHPLGISRCQIVVNRNDVNAFARDGIEVGGQRTNQRFTFASAHFSNLAKVQHHAADHLHVEMAHTQFALAGFTHHGESFR